ELAVLLGAGPSRPGRGRRSDRGGWPRTTRRGLPRRVLPPHHRRTAGQREPILDRGRGPALERGEGRRAAMTQAPKQQWVGVSRAAVDAPLIVTGEMVYVTDLRLPDTVYGAVLR